MFRDLDTEVKVVLFIIFGIITFGIITYILNEMPGEGTHEWKGGSGPSTTCYYETRTEWTDKTSYDVLYTVCKDAR